MMPSQLLHRGPARNARRGRRVTGVLALLVPLVSGVIALPVGAADRPPNVLLIVADDLGYEGLGANGGESYETPNLDALAAGGLRFERCFATPVCTPSRVQLLTGRYGFRTGQVNSVLPVEERTFAQVLGGVGYRTAVAGKWKLCDFREQPDHPREVGFDEFRLWAGRGFAEDDDIPPRYWGAPILENGELLEGTAGRFAPDLYCDFLVDFMERHRTEPFLAYYPMALVHAPAKPTPTMRSGGRTGPADNQETFGEMVAYMDRLVGRLVAKLDELGLREETLIIFTADNGTSARFVSTLDGREIEGGKGSMRNEGFHVPFVASWPGVIEGGRVTDELVDFSDILPTLAEVSGAPLPPGVLIDGRSFTSLLRGEPHESRRWIYVQQFEQRCVFDGRWKLHQDGRLLDLREDPREERPTLAGDEGPEATGAREQLDLLLSLLTKPGARHPDPDRPDSGRWRRIRTDRHAPRLTDEQRAQIEQLEALGYVDGSAPVPSTSGVTVHDADRAFGGLNFYTSGHAPEAYLMGMDGEVLHTWSYRFRDIWPDHPVTSITKKTQHWRRGWLYPDGDVLAIFEGVGIVKVDRDSNLLWAYGRGEHHDIDVLENGDIYVLTRRARLVPRIHESEPILEDFIGVLDQDGKLKREVSLLECFENAPHPEAWSGTWEDNPDIFHTNTVEVLDGRLSGRVPGFERGNVLTSMRTIHAIAVVDLDQRKVVWARAGDFRGQHDPQVTDSGSVLLFDNKGLGPRSRILELDPATMETVWEYRGTTGSPFFSGTCGTTRRLPNGNTLVTESDAGRAFELTTGGEIVWEFISPHRAGDSDEFVATLFDVVRLDPTFPVDWIAGPVSGP